jgi:hypothetical protein
MMNATEDEHKNGNKRSEIISKVIMRLSEYRQ